MTAVNSEPTTIALSVEELLAVLNALETSTVPGLEVEGWTSLSPDKQDLALSVAHRALEARGLARMEDGELKVHRALLTAVGICAFPQQSTLVDHWSPGGAAQRLFAHTRETDNVVHIVEGNVHTFTLFSSEKQLADHVAAACSWDGASAGSALELTMKREDFTRACDASADGAEADAVKALGAGGSTDAGPALVKALASGPRISVVQRVRFNTGDAATEQSFTVIEGAGRTWCVTPVAEGADAPLRARTVSRADITALLQGR
jgi:hypothetical protein